jgi:hypothetical protein
MGVVGVCREAFFGPGIAKPRPGKSSRGGRFVLPANFGDVGREFILLRLRDGRCSNVTGFVVAVNKAFAADVLASAHKGGVIPLGAILGAPAGKMLFPVFVVLQQELGDGGGVLGDALPVDVSWLPLLPPLLFAVALGVRSTSGGSRRGLWGRLDEVWRKGDVDGAVHHHLKDLVKTNKTVVHH